MNIDLLKKLTSAFGTSGNEEEVAKIVENELKDYADTITYDALGNLTAFKKSNIEGAKKFMLCAHLDEIGIIVTYIDKEGFIRFGAIGGLNLSVCNGQRVMFKNGTTGVVAVEEKADSSKGLKANLMYIDIGAKDFDSASALVNVGDTAVFCGELVQNGDTVISKALDDRIGVFALIEAFKNFENPAYDVYAVFTSQEEVGLRGAKAGAYNVEPDLAIAIDVTDTGDTPNSNPMAVKLGEGVCIKLKDNSIITHKTINDMLKVTAEKNNIKYQLEVLTFGGTDAGAIHISKGGAVTGALSVPTRHIHTPCETVALNDVKGLISLLTEFVKN